MSEEAMNEEESFEMTPESIEAMADAENGDTKASAEEDVSDKAKVEEEVKTDASVEAQPDVDAPKGETAPEYSPDFSYKIQSTKKEFPEQFRDIIKSKEDEDFVRDVMTKADGLELVKNHNDSLMRESEQANKIIHEITAYRDKLDLGGMLDYMNIPKDNPQMLIESLGINKQDVLTYALAIAEGIENPKGSNLTTDNGNVYSGNTDLQKQNWIQEQQLQNVQKQYQDQLMNMQVQQREVELQNSLGQQSIAQTQQKFDQEHGPGSFRNRVIEAGKMLTQASRAMNPRSPEATVDQAVGAVVERYEFDMWKSGASNPGVTSQQTQQTTSQSQKRKEEIPVIPDVGSGSGDHAGEPVISSLDDIRKIYKQEYGNQNI